MAPTQKQQQNQRGGGGLKGFFLRAGKSFWTAGEFCKTNAFLLAKMGGKFGFIFATTTMVTFMPLMMEIFREGQMIESERSQVRDLKTKGFSDRQLQEMGFCTPALHTPSVAGLK